MNLAEPAPADPLWQGPVLAHEDGYRWIAVPMLYNHRLVCVPDDGLGCASYGWCYTSSAALHAAAAHAHITKHKEGGRL